MLLWVVAFRPEPLWWGTVPGMVGALWLIERCRSTGSFVRWSLLFGALAIGYGYRWLAPTITLFGGVPTVPAWLLTALFGILGILHGWVFAFLYRSMLARGHRPHPLTTAALWVACESLIPRLFPWMVGHGLVDVAPVRMAAEWGGVPAVSFVTLCLVIPLHEVLRWALPLPGRPAARPGAAALTFVVGLALTGYGMVRYGEVRELERAAPERIAVGIVQPNIGSLHKREDENRRSGAREDTVEGYTRGSRRAAEQGAELIVWPETAVTDSIAYRTSHRGNTNGLLDVRGFKVLSELGVDHDFLLGAYEKHETKADVVNGKPAPDERWNVAALRGRGGLGAKWSTFRKVYLIPFGEAMPLGLPDSYLPQRFRMLEGEPPQSLLEVGRHRLLPFLCYEGILADYVREAAGDQRPALLVSLANDSWFGDTWEPWQHLNFTRFRAVEHRTPLVRATNTGVSAFVSATGEVEGRLAVGVDDVLVRDVPILDTDRTIYVRYGHHLPWALGIWGLLAWIASLATPRRPYDSA
jgi:apolipoprotein N-acyltransferase